MITTSWLTRKLCCSLPALALFLAVVHLLGSNWLDIREIFLVAVLFEKVAACYISGLR